MKLQYHEKPEHHNLLPYIRMVTGAMDYALNSRTVTNTETLKINLAPGGGWIAKVIKSTL